MVARQGRRNGGTRSLWRRLRGYSFDPSLSTQLETAVINETVYRVRWEEPAAVDARGSLDERCGLRPGPIGEYVEVIDYDPASGCFYAPVDLNQQSILGQDGLAPSEGNPQFHQQFVYAVAMTTIANFERALGRPTLWSPRRVRLVGGPDRYEFVQRLRIYPHALREPNAYYSPAKKALLFGYFPASGERPDRYLPGGMVFTCLSHDIIAHEATHALLDGMHRRFIEANHPDGLAFHEAFADIVALFQRFSFSDVLAHQIRRTRGDLSAPNLLGELAQQFGEAIGNYGALRSAIGQHNKETGKWEPHKPDPRDYESTVEPHARGAILVAAIFDAFMAIYRHRVADLMRIASSGTGILPAGELHPDLVGRLAAEAAKTARQILNVCIRALDYCPPVDITFGDYFRAIITADADLVSDDKWNYRVAFIEAFRRRGIYPRDVRTLSVESLLWRCEASVDEFFRPLADFLRSRANDIQYLEDREALFEASAKVCRELHGWIESEGHQLLKTFSKAAGLTFEFGLAGLRPPRSNSRVPRFEVHSIRPARRVGPDGESLNQLIVTIIQSRVLPVDPQGAANGQTISFRGGCTLILDLDTMRLRYLIAKDVTDEDRLERHRGYHGGSHADGSVRGLYFKRLAHNSEPFAALHGGEDMWAERVP